MKRQKMARESLMCHTNCYVHYCVYHKGLKNWALLARWFYSPFLQNCVLFLVREMTSSQLFLHVKDFGHMYMVRKTFFKMPF